MDPANTEQYSPMKEVSIQQFLNFGETAEIDDEKAEENKEMTEQELESLETILNAKEFEVIDVQGDHPLVQAMGKEELENNSIKFLLKLSIVPKFDESVQYRLHDQVTKQTVSLRSLPSIELVIALPVAYPSSQRPLFFQMNKFYAEFLPIEDFVMEKVNEKWTEEMPVLYEVAILLQDEIMEQYFEENGKGDESIGGGSFVNTIQLANSQLSHAFLKQAQEGYRRQFDEEQHVCTICTRDQLGAKFFFMSGCQHYFCTECIREMVLTNINEGQIANLKCAEASCGQTINDHDIKNLGLDDSLMKKYEKLSLDNAIAQMDDMGWCPLPTCRQLANIDKEQNQGKCSFCDFMFCLDCKERIHPYKRCLIHRIDLKEAFMKGESIQLILKRNRNSEEVLNKLFIKHCTKSCPNPKCGVPITKIESGCTQVQCPKCFNYFCWCCGAPAKGQKHYKENPDHYNDEGTLLPSEVTPEIIKKHCNEDVGWVNLKFCAACPKCEQLNEKTGTNNALTCKRCQGLFCYICNKTIDGLEHFKGKQTCREHSNPYDDL